MNIVFAIDKGYLQHLSVALASLLANNSGMRIYIINSDIVEKDWGKLLKLLEGNDSVLIDVKIDDTRIESLITFSYFTKASYYRLFIPDMVQGEKALYLDADIVVNARLDDLYNTDISNTFIAAVHNPGVAKNADLEMDSTAKYFNSGVMLINLESWRRNMIPQKVIEFIERKPEVIQFVDQDGLNAVINGKWLKLHPKYNVHTFYLSFRNSSDHVIKEAIDNPVIIHYTGDSKPWHWGHYYPYKHLYWKYLRTTPYKYSIPSKPSTIFSIGFAQIITPKPIKSVAKKFLKMLGFIKKAVIKS